MVTGTCEFMERRHRYGTLVEVCALNFKLCMVDTTTCDYRNCARRLWALEHASQLKPSGDDQNNHPD